MTYLEIAQIAHTFFLFAFCKSVNKRALTCSENLAPKGATTKGENSLMKLINSAWRGTGNFVVVLSLFVAVGMTPNLTASANGPTLTKSEAALTADIVDTAVAAGSFTTLAKALDAAGLIDCVEGGRTFHSVCANRCSICQATRWYYRFIA
ncbi:hypothetical protein BH18ACI4_BH18ACI4_22420 [soil metagenome]